MFFKHYKNLIVAGVLCSTPLFAAWNSNLQDGLKQAGESGKDVLAVFTGSDWCPPCKMLKQKVLSQDEAIKELEKTFVLVELDFPRQAPIDAELKKINAAAQKKYNVSGFPSVIQMTSKGQAYAISVGATHQNPQDYLAHLKQAGQHRQQFVAAMEKAQSLEGMPKAEAMVAALKMLPKELLSSYEEELATLKKLDPKDTLQFVTPIEQEQQLYDLYNSISEFAKAKQMDKFDAKVDEFLARTDLLPAIRQQALVRFKLGRLVMLGKAEEAQSIYKQIMDIDPNSASAAWATRKIGELKPKEAPAKP